MAGQNALARNLRKAREQFKYIPHALRLIWEAARGWTLWWFVILVIQGLLPTATVYLTKVLVDSVAAAVGGGLSPENVRLVLVPALLMAGVLLLTQVLKGVANWVRTAQSEQVQDHVKTLIHEKAAEVDLEFYETAGYYDHMSRANGQAASRSMSLLQNIGGLLQNAITLVGIAALLIPYAWWLPLALLFSTLPAFWVVVHHNNLHHEWWEATTKDRRWVNYFDRVLTDPTTAPEVRIFGLGNRFRTAYKDLRRVLRESRLRLLRNQNIAGLWAGVSALVITGAVMVWMVWRALQGAATLGDLALFYQAFNQGQGLMRALLSSAGNLYTDALFLEHLFTFLELKPGVKSPEEPHPTPDALEKGIRFEHLGFRYPETERWALRGFSLEIPARKTVAIVGPNGAGKSTLAKLLCRFYDPEEGRILIDGTDIRDLDVKALRRMLTAMFQHPVRYVATAAENISLGDVEAEAHPERIREAARAGGALEIIESLPDGYDTLLSRQFKDGTELSGGQWQRVTLARAFFRQAPIVILDEPTSFMDSWAETQWLERFRKLVEDRTAIIITHRFTTAMRADIIHVMEEGRIIESGRHEELLRRGGAYAASWSAQMDAERATPAEDPGADAFERPSVEVPEDTEDSGAEVFQ